MMPNLVEDLTPEEEAIIQGQTAEPEPAKEEAVEEPAPEEETAVQEEELQEVDTQDQDDEKQETPEKPPKGFVPHQALKEERIRRQELQEELRKQREQQARLEERTRLILEHLQKTAQPQEEAPQPPSPEEDPLAYIQHLGNEVQELRQMTEQERAALQQQQQLAQVIQQGDALAAQYRNEVGPEIYDKAFEHVVSTRRAELKAHLQDEAMVEQALQNELIQGMIGAMQAGRNPGELLMEIAKARGFSHETAEKKAVAKSKAEMIERGQAQSKGLSNAQSTGEGPITAKDIANMSQEEFNAYLAKNNISDEEAMKILAQLG